MATFVYSDESGINGGSRYFIIGMLIVEDRPTLLKLISDIRSDQRCHRELHWNEMSNSRYRCYADILDKTWIPSIRYCCICVDKRKVDLDAYFDGKRYLMYNYFTKLLFTKRLIGDMQAVCFIDFKNREKLDNGVDYLKRQVNKEVTGCLKHVQPLHSHQDDCLQVCDIITGAIHYRMEHSLGSTRRGQLAAILHNKMADLVLAGKLDVWIWHPRQR
ncbi:MAG TPA: DUF3800 domain-containing protein [Armatimonadota bacterium]|nr:DUF3800 domain-containing protein [Armatimonadota bacterium]